VPVGPRLCIADVAYAVRDLPAAARRRRARREHLDRIRRWELERLQAAQRLDPRVCHRWWEYVDLLDPYGDDPDRARETCIGRWYFVANPDGGPKVEEHVARQQHPEYSVHEWLELMVAAERRWYADTGVTADTDILT
jgi:hypothetical protein